MCRAAAAALNFAAETQKFFMSNIDKIHDSPVAPATCAQACATRAARHNFNTEFSHDYGTFPQFETSHDGLPGDL